MGFSNARKGDNNFFPGLHIQVLSSHGVAKKANNSSVSCFAEHLKSLFAEKASESSKSADSSVCEVVLLHCESISNS